MEAETPQQVVRKYRALLEVSYREFTELMNKACGMSVSHQTVANWEQGVNSPNLTHVTEMLAGTDNKGGVFRDFAIDMMEAWVNK